METLDERLTRIMREATDARITVIDVARAYASIDGKRREFEFGEESDDIEAGGGHYLGYMAEAEEILIRATKYARMRVR